MSVSGCTTVTMTGVGNCGGVFVILLWVTRGLGQEMGLNQELVNTTIPTSGKCMYSFHKQYSAILTLVALAARVHSILSGRTHAIPGTGSPPRPVSII